jgi:hypothetical protein
MCAASSLQVACRETEPEGPLPRTRRPFRATAGSLIRLTMLVGVLPAI